MTIDWSFRVVCCAAIIVTAPAAQTALAAAIDEAPQVLFVDEKGAEHPLSRNALAKLPRTTAKVVGRDGEMIEYQGVALPVVLQHCGVTLGKELRGERVASYLLCEAKDGYRVVLAIGEVDPATTDKLVLLADTRDGAPLDDNEGPFRVVIPDDKRPVRWIRMLNRVAVVRAAQK